MNDEETKFEKWFNKNSAPGKWLDTTTHWWLGMWIFFLIINLIMLNSTTTLRPLNWFTIFVICLMADGIGDWRGSRRWKRLAAMWERSAVKSLKVAEAALDFKERNRK